MFSAGGVATPADAALMMGLGAEGVFVGSGIFKSEDPERTATARSSRPTTHYRDAPSASPQLRGILAPPMTGIGMDDIEQSGGLLQNRGW